MGKVAKSFWLCVWMPCLQQTVPRARPAALPRARCIESKAAPRVHGIGQKLIVEELWLARVLLGSFAMVGSQSSWQYGDGIAKKILEIDPGDVGAYVLLSNIHAAAGKWDSSANIHHQRLEGGYMD
ncbi:unnamed protein product [Sphagnum compactum]